MRKDTLPSPGPLSMGLQLHACMAKAISSIEISSVGGAGKAPYAARLDAFLVAARTAIATYIDAVVPTVLTRTVGTVPATRMFGQDWLTGQIVRVRTSKELDRSYVPAPAAFAIAGSTISYVQVEGPDILLLLAAPVAVGDGTKTVAYTQPGAVSNVRDLSGNLLASFVATGVVNTVT